LELERIIAGLSELISPKEDDVRAYHVPDRCEVAMLGRQDLPDGIVLGGRGLGRLLRAIREDGDSPSIDVYNDDVESGEACYLV